MKTKETDFEKFEKAFNELKPFGIDRSENEKCIEIEINKKSIAIVFDKEEKFNRIHIY